MSTKRHYIKIPHTIAPWVPGGAHGDWQGEIFRDIAGGGTELVGEYLSPNEKGDRTALYGDRFYIEIGRDRDRRDSVFLMRVQSADVRLPRSTPLKLAARLVLWPGGYPPDLDQVDQLFRPREEQREEQQDTLADASPLLLSLLLAAPEQLRERLRPGPDVPEPEAPREFLDPLRQLRARYRLDRHLRLSARQDMLLRTQSTPADLPRSERDALLEAFGFGLLNEIALANESQLLGFVESLASIPVPARLRARLWVASLGSLSNAEFRRELHASADALTAIATSGSPSSLEWRTVLAPGLRDVAERTDGSLRDLFADAGDDSGTLLALAEWAKALAFSTTPAAEHGPGEPELPATGPARGPAKPSSVADDWVMKLRLPDERPLDQLRASVISAARELESVTSAQGSVESLVAFDERVSALSARGAEWRDLVGDIGALQADLLECQTAFAELQSVLGDEAERLVREHFVLPAEVTEIAGLLRHPLLAEAPDWLLSVDAETEQPERPGTMAAWASVLIHNRRRRCLQMFCDLAKELNEPQAIVWLTAPDPGSDPELHLREWFERVRGFLLDMPVEIRAMLGGGGADFNKIQEDAALIARLRSDIPPALWNDVERDLHAASDVTRSQLLAAYSRAVAFLSSEVDGWEALPFQTLKTRTAKELSRTAPVTTPAPESVAAGLVTVEHNFLEGRTSRATLLFAPAESGEDYGYVTVPLVLETEQPRALSAALQWDVKGDARSGWSRDWPGPDPGERDTVAVPVLGWRRQPDGTRWHYCLSARIPIRTPKAANPRVEADVTVCDADAGRPLGPARSLKWESIGLKPVSISVVWGDATDPGHVRDHPIGPQERANSLRDRFAAGGSVAVIAPRRFGKSTLVEYLVKEGVREKLLVPPALVCTKYKGAAGFDYESFWSDLSARLVDKLGARLKHESSTSLPAPEAFDAVRIAARKKGYRAIVVLMDEAQLFFAGQKGELGSHLKTLIERDLARSDDAKKAPLVFGLIGLPTLRERAGADLMGLLNPIEKSRMDEAELRPLISKMTSGLQTTRGARQRLADTAGNLLILKALLENLALRATRDRRVWVNHDDVVAVEETLKKELQEGRELTVASYVRDVLNSADSVDDWRPIPSFPVGAAWAHKWTPGRPDGELHAKTLELLNEWCRLSHGGEDHGVRPVYTPELVSRHLHQLRERQVLSGAEFASPLLRAWLAGLASRRNFDDSFRDALFSGAQRRIKLPSGAAPVAQGGEAAIWRSGPFAYRVKALPGSQDRDQFLESVEMLEALRQVVHRREAGSDHVFDLVDMGLSEKNDREAIQVYRWVEGQSLDLREGGLAADMVIEIGAKLARGVRLLHRNGLLHRDICPRNIVLDDVSDASTIRPVLIDFGFAKLATASMRTAITGQHIAPEVRGPKPEWGRPADIYALASSLESLLDKTDAAADLRPLLSKAMADTPDARPTAEQLLDALEGLETDRKVHDRREATWRDLWAAVSDSRHVPWFSAQMNKTRESLVNVALRYYRSPMHHYGVVADFFNQLAETCPSLKKPAWNLGQRDGDESLKTLGAIRNQHVHGRGNQLEEQRILIQRFEAMSASEQKATIRRSVHAIATACQLASLLKLADKLLG